MKKYIVTTTINSPTLATQLYCNKEDWTVIVVGDKKTPHNEYKELRGCIYLTPEYQQQEYPELSDIIGWNTIQRRNIGFIEAYRRGADVLATVDDDNIPYETWGNNLLLGQTAEVDFYTTDNIVFDPLSVTNHSNLWHRGFPIELLKVKNNITYQGKKNMHVKIQADLWDGDPDIDAICRLSLRPIVKFNTQVPYASNKLSPFNSQNTFLLREVIPHYTVLPHVGRMDDIWASYYVQTIFKDNLVYNSASVYQDRNAQDLILNLEKEIIGYRNTLNFIKQDSNILTAPFVPERTKEFFECYKKQFN